MKQQWLLLGIFWLCLASVKAPDPKIQGSIQRMKDIAEAARMKYIQGKGLNKGLPLKTTNEHTSVKKDPVSERFTIKKISKATSGTTFTIISESGDPINGIVNIGLGIVSAQGNDDYESAYYNTPMTGTFDTESSVIFPFDISSLKDEDLTLFAVTGRGINDEVIAAGSVSYNAKDITPSAVDRVGVDNDGDVAIRLAYPQSFNVHIIVRDGTADLCTCTVYPCYCVGLNTADSATEVCTEVTSLETPNPKFQLCDSTVTENVIFGLINVNSASLTYTKLTEANLEIDTDNGGNPNSVEIVYYQANEKTTMSSINCASSKELCKAIISDIEDTDIDNRILVINKDLLNKVTGSALHDFEDYKLKLSQISGTTLEARWTTRDLDQFEISVDGLPTGKVVNECSDCIAYLTTLNSDNPYIISIKKISDSLGANVVGFTKQLDATTVTILTIAKILKKTATAVQLCVTAASDVTGITNMNLAFLITDNSPGIQYVYQLPRTDDIPATPETCIDFTVAAEALEETAYTVIITAHNTQNEPIAAGEVPFTLKALTPDLDRVGASAGDQTSSFRIRTDSDITVNDNSCSTAEGVCYLLALNAPESDNVEVCYEATLKTRLCDGEKTANQFTEIATVETVKLTYDLLGKKTLEVAATFLGTSENMEIIIHADTAAIPKQECTIQGSDATKSCSTTTFTDDDPGNPFSILKVALDGSSKVVESHTALFENYATSVQQLTTDLIEVRWSAFAQQIYLISLDKTVTGAYDKVTVDCGGGINDKCKAYFMMLLQETYEVSVQPNSDGGQNIVAGTVDMQSFGSENLNITSVALEDRGNTIGVTVCFNHNSNPVNSAELTMIDRSGNWLSSPAFSSEEGLCIGNLTFDTSFNTSAPIRILVSSDNSTYGDTDLYLLDSNAQKSTAYVSIKQVGQTTLRATWANLNDASSYQISSDASQNQSEVCDYRKECGRYIHLSPNAPSPVTIKITENGDIVQTLSLDVDITAAITPITISSISMRWDDHVQVCFIAPAGVSTYELGLEVSNDLLESTQSPQLVSGDNGTSCLVSEKTVEIGAYIELWSLVSAFGQNGNLLASGFKVLKSIFLSASQSVYGASTTSSFLTTWHLLDNAEGIDKIKVTLLALDTEGTRVIETVNVTADETSYAFGKMPEGKYSICVIAVVEPEGITSEEICSDIIRVHSMTVEVPQVVATPPKTTSEDAVLVTWQPPQEEEVTGFYISWNKSPALLSVPETNKDTHIRRATEGTIDPLELIKFAKAPSRATGTRFTIVSSSETSFEVKGLDKGQTYSICISSVQDDVVGFQDCSESDLSEFEALEKPTNLKYENGNGILSWTSKELDMHRVEWQSRTDKKESNYAEVNGTELQLDLAPGEWEIEVRAITDFSSSEATRLTVTVEGLVISAKQREQTSLLVSWYEQKYVVSAASDMTEKLYEIWLYKNGDIIAGPKPIYCSGYFEDNCHYEFQNLTVLSTDTVNVRVKSETIEYKDYEFPFHNITGITILSKKVRSSEEVEVTWEEVPQAKKYIYTIYETEALDTITDQGKTPETKMTLTMPNITGKWLTVQGCTDEQHCGNLAKSALNQESGNNNDNKTTIIIAATVSTVVGVGLILVIVAILMRKSKKGRGGGNKGSRKEGKERTYDTWGARILGRPKETRRVNPEELPRSPSSRENYGIPSSFDVHS